ncbi:histone-lysine N-methyltransferase SETMAR-like [Rhynchophorus ferrugineus]|uniref:histone-lysine N-methyltransferase SETMAR-like n=1 Tax=Rhynchophorus ferrugineus TaxID=354439 RepID=UPI003FCC4B3F
MKAKQIRLIFLFEYKLGRKAAEAARNINEAFGQGTASERTVQWWFKKFRNGDESLETEKRSGRPSEVDSERLKALVEADPYMTTRELAKELGVCKTTISHHLRKIGKL